MARLIVQSQAFGEQVRHPFGVLGLGVAVVRMAPMGKHRSRLRCWQVAPGSRRAPGSSRAPAIYAAGGAAPTVRK
jgi:hypothetical protein